ncbi:MAG TPA: FlgD immunoglobulin-like domain containing protein [Candidatus Eisenbacteria bacterium]|nr:FlgD immunoglobulin-like domain containing protein [Candidatus Eisenbacteria bacterium]
MLPGRLAAPFWSIAALLIFITIPAAPCHAAKGSIWLRWTATGDDGTIGRAARYDIRYSTQAISGTDTVGWWNSATIVNTNGKVPPPPGMPDSVLIINVTYGQRYYAMMRVADEIPNWSRFSNLARFDVVTGVEDEFAPSAPPARVQAAPNPFASSTAIQFAIPTAGETDVSVYDVAGRLVRRVHQGSLRAGAHALDWDGRDEARREVRSGVYFIQIRSGATALRTKVFRMR